MSERGNLQQRLTVKDLNLKPTFYGLFAKNSCLFLLFFFQSETQYLSSVKLKQLLEIKFLNKQQLTLIVV